jgi:L-lactate dehydrogenase (cytochrome)
VGIDRCFNVDDFRKLAHRRLPAPLFHYIDGGADNEWTLRNNTAAFDRYTLMPSGLADTSSVDMTREVLGQKLSMPLFLAPTGMSRLFHHEGERAVARAAAKAGTLYSLSTVSSVSIEDIGALTTGPKMFQIYIHKDRGLTHEFINRCKASGFNAMCLTVDTIVAGNRERDLRTGMTMPPKFTLSSLLSFAMHPRWTLNYLTHGKIGLANVADRIAAGTAAASSVIDYINEQFDRTLTWKDAEDAIAAWGGPFAIKGVMSVADARRAVEVGASAIMISNHGGRQLDSAPAPVDCVEAIVDAVGGKIEVIVDGGIRRGTHVLKALALGATACSMGKAYLYALAAGGEAGVARLLSRLRMEIERDMMLMGVTRLDQVTRDKISKL